MTESTASELQACKTAEEVEKILERLTPEVIAGLNEADAGAFSKACDAVSADTAVSNARLRRRLKRVTESIEQRESLVQRVQEKVQAEIKEAMVPQHGSYASSSSARSTRGGGDITDDTPRSKKPRGEVITHSVGMAEAAMRLMAPALGVWDVEQVLNNLLLPEKQGTHAAEFVVQRGPLSQALARAVGLEGVKGVLKRRLQRLQFTMADDKVREKAKSAAASKAAAAAAASAAAAAALLPPAQHISSALAAMKNVQDATALEAALLGVNERSVGSDPERAALIASVEKALGNTHLVANSKDRRRVKRVLEALQAPASAPVPEPEPVEAPAAAPAAALALAPTAPATVASVTAALAAASAAADNAAMLAAVSDVSAVVLATPAADVSAAAGPFDDLKVLVRELSTNSETTAPVRRKAQRALQAMESAHAAAATKTAVSVPAPAAAVTAAATALPTTVVLHNPPSGPALDDAIAAVKEVTTAAQLEQALSTIRAGHGNMRSRRTLRRAVGALLGEGSKLSAEMNSKQRRSISRVLNVLEGKADSGAREVSVDELHTLVGATKAHKILGIPTVEETEAAAVGAKRKRGSEAGGSSTPYVVFIGQLSYKTTSEEITKHLHANGINTAAQGFQVRLLTERDNSAHSRGSAFVQLSNAEQLHECLSLHHSVLHGRRINVEKSCGGRNKDARADKLAERRADQNKAVNAKIDVVLNDYETKGVLVVSELGSLLKERLYSFTATHVCELMEEYSNQPREQRTKRDLDKLLDAWEEKRYGKKGSNFQLQGQDEEGQEGQEEDAMREM